MPDQHKNFAYAAIATAPSPAASGTSLVVSVGAGARFPAVPFNVTIWPAAALPLPANAEIVRVTNIATDTFTIVRTQESTSARTIVVGDQIAATITNKTLTDIESGGIRVTSQAIGDLLYASAVDQLARIASVATGKVLQSAGVGVVPVWGDGGTIDISIQDFRLTLVSGTPVSGADAIGATAIFAAPMTGNRIALYDGAAWNIRTSAEFTLALGTLTSGKIYDVFCYDNAGVPTLEFLAWTNDTTRATALVRQDGVLVKSGAVTRRYMGKFYTTATTTTEDSEAKRLLSNHYHARPRKMKVYEATTSWAYTLAVWRQARATATNQLEFLTGEDETVVDAWAAVSVGNGTGLNMWLAIGLDSTTAPAADSDVVAGYVNGWSIGLRAHYTGRPGAGRHLLVWLEYSVASGTSTWYANGGLSASNASGMQGTVMA